MEPIPVCLSSGPGAWTFAALVVVVCAIGFGAWVALGFVLHYYDASNRGEPIAAGRVYVRAFFYEWIAELAETLCYPLGLVWPTGPQGFDPNGGPPVVFVPGYGRNRGIFFVLYWRLRRYGYRNLYPLSLGATTTSIVELGDTLATQIESISRLAGGQKVVAVCHSMGGLVLRSSLKRRPETPVAKMITLGTPHNGTRLAHLGVGESSRQMRPGSAFLAELKPGPAVPCVCLYSRLDNTVIPAVSAALGDKVIAFEDLGHGTLLYAVEVFDMVLHELA